MPQMINDHSSWAGSTAGGKVPQGDKVKTFSSAEGAGHLNTYEDTSEKIKSAQEKAKAKVKSHPPKESYRN